MSALLRGRRVNCHIYFLLDEPTVDSSVSSVIALLCNDSREDRWWGIHFCVTYVVLMGHGFDGFLTHSFWNRNSTSRKKIQIFSKSSLFFSCSSTLLWKSLSSTSSSNTWWQSTQVVSDKCAPSTSIYIWVNHFLQLHSYWCVQQSVYSHFSDYRLRPYFMSLLQDSLYGNHLNSYPDCVRDIEWRQTLVLKRGSATKGDRWVQSLGVPPNSDTRVVYEFGKVHFSIFFNTFSVSAQTEIISWFSFVLRFDSGKKNFPKARCMNLLSADSIALFESFTRKIQKFYWIYHPHALDVLKSAYTSVGYPMSETKLCYDPTCSTEKYEARYCEF